MILVSACLAGFEVTYKGSDNLHKRIQKWFREKKAVPVCPEVLGGLSIPRDPAEIIGGDGDDVLDGRAKVVTKYGDDVTEAFIKGAKETLAIVQKEGAEVVILKERSPSCGGNRIYNGEFNGTKKSGQGVTAALLRRHGIQVLSEENFHEYLDDVFKGTKPEQS